MRFRNESCPRVYILVSANGRDNVHKSVDARFTGLRYLAVHPEYQKKGIGRALVTAVVGKADELGIDVYIMAYEAGRLLYEQLGFREIERTTVYSSKYGGEDHLIYFMIYNARKGNGHE